MRAQALELLNQRLADCIDLQTQCKQAHWNVKGANFIALHKLFDDINETVEAYVDLLAERVVQLGGVAEGTLRLVAGRSTLDSYPPDITIADQHIDALAGALAAFGHNARRDIDTLAELHDPVSADIATEIARGIDKWRWFVEAHLPPREGQAVTCPHDPFREVLPQAIALESPMPRSPIPDREEPELAFEPDIPVDEEPDTHA